MNDDSVIPPVYYLEDTAGSAVPGSFGATVDNFGGAAGTINNFTALELIQLFIVYAFVIAAGLAAVFIFVGGVSFILSGGQDEKIKSAINTIRYSIVGLIVTILSFTFIMIVGRIFGLDLLGYISYDQIKCSINRLIQFGEDPTNNECRGVGITTRR